MTINVTTLGSYTRLVEYSSGELVQNLMSQITTVLIGCGWEVWDAAAGASSVCYRSPYVGGIVGTASHYKYMVLDAGASGYLVCRLWELWDNTTHTGTNLARNTYTLGSNVGENALAQRVDLLNGGVLYINASARHALFFSKLASLGWGSSSGGAWCGVFERERRWDALATGFPAAIWMSGAGVTQSAGGSGGAVSTPRAPFTGKTASSSESTGVALYMPDLLAAMYNGTWSAAMIGPEQAQGDGFGAPRCSAAIAGYGGSGVYGASSQWGRLFAAKIGYAGALPNQSIADMPVDAAMMPVVGGAVTAHIAFVAQTASNPLVMMLPL